MVAIVSGTKGHKIAVSPATFETINCGNHQRLLRYCDPGSTPHAKREVTRCGNGYWGSKGLTMIHGSEKEHAIAVAANDEDSIANRGYLRIDAREANWAQLSSYGLVSSQQNNSNRGDHAPLWDSSLRVLHALLEKPGTVLLNTASVASPFSTAGGESNSLIRLKTWDLASAGRP